VVSSPVVGSDLWYPIPLSILVILIRYGVENFLFRPVGETITINIITATKASSLWLSPPKEPSLLLPPPKEPSFTFIIINTQQQHITPSIIIKRDIISDIIVIKAASLS
jgi:hypothetical protein